MGRWYRHPVLQILLYTALLLGVGYQFGLIIMVFVSPAYAALVLPSVFQLSGSFWHGVRCSVWMPVHGKHHVYKDITLHLHTDPRGGLWLPLHEVESVVGPLLAERTLALQYPGKVHSLGKPLRPHIHFDALLPHLGKRNDQVALRFKHWLDRNIVFPDRKRQAAQASDDVKNQVHSTQE